MPGAARPAIEVLRVVVDCERGAHRLGRIAERRHHRVADSFDDAAAVALNPLGEKGEMVAHQTERGGVAEFVVEAGRALQVGEQDRDAADLHFVARAQQLLGTQAAENGHRNYRLAGQRIVRPGAVLDHEEQRPARVVAHGEFLASALAENDVVARRGRPRGSPRPRRSPRPPRRQLRRCGSGSRRAED